MACSETFTRPPVVDEVPGLCFAVQAPAAQGENNVQQRFPVVRVGCAQIAVEKANKRVFVDVRMARVVVLEVAVEELLLGLAGVEVDAVGAEDVCEGLVCGGTGGGKRVDRRADEGGCAGCVSGASSAGCAKWCARSAKRCAPARDPEKI